MNRSNEPDGLVRIFWLDLKRHSRQLLDIDEARRIASPNERAQAQKLKPRLLDVAYYLAGHIALRMILAKFAVMPRPDVEFCRSASGKPSLAGGDIEFSYAASGNFAVIALHKTYPLGIDFESKAPLHFSHNELETAAWELPGLHEQNTAVNRTLAPPGLAGWMLLEAWTKMKGERLADNISSATQVSRRIISEIGCHHYLRMREGGFSAIRFVFENNQMGICCCQNPTADYDISQFDPASFEIV